MPAWIPAAISGGLALAGKIFGNRSAAGLGGSLLGGWLASRQAKPSAQAMEAQQMLLDTSRGASTSAADLMKYIQPGMDQFNRDADVARYYVGRAGDTLSRSDELINRAEGQFDRAERMYDPYEEYARKLHSGGPAAMEAISPQLSALREQNAQQAANIHAFGARGGGRASALMQMPDEIQRGTTDLLSQARQQGAELGTQIARDHIALGQGRTQLGSAQTQVAEVRNRLAQSSAQIGQLAAQLGMQAGELATRLMQIAIYGPRSVLDFDIKNRYMQMEAVMAGARGGGQIGQSIFDIAQDVVGGLGGPGSAGTPEFFPPSDYENIPGNILDQPFNVGPGGDFVHPGAGSTDMYDPWLDYYDMQQSPRAGGTGRTGGRSGGGGGGR